MKQTHNLQQKLRQFAFILVPILVSQITLYAMSFFDTIMSGRAGTNDLAGVAIGSSIWLPIHTGLNGILLAVTPIVAQLIGGKQKENISPTVIQALYLSLLIASLVIGVGAIALKPILAFMNLEGAVEIIAFRYMVALGLGIVPYFAYTVLRCFIDALGKTNLTMLITLVSLPTNIFLNYSFIFGKFGFPRLGGVGAGIATALTYWFILVITILVVVKVDPFKKYKIFTRLYPVVMTKQLEIITIGVPIGFAIFLETAIFAVITLLMSKFNTVTIAAHQAAMNFESLLFMIPLSMSMALTILVGFEVGARRLPDANAYQRIGTSFSLLLAVFCALSLLLFREQVAAFYSEDLAVIKLTKHFLLYAIFFQLSDAIAAPIQGTLRGYKDVNITSIMAFIAYWVVALPLGYVLATYTKLGASGYWLGMIAGVSTSALGLLSRLLWIQKQNSYHIASK